MKMYETMKFVLIKAMQQNAVVAFIDLKGKVIEVFAPSRNTSLEGNIRALQDAYAANKKARRVRCQRFRSAT